MMMAYLEVESFDDFEDLVSRKGSHWDDDIYLYSGFDWEDYGREMFSAMGYDHEIPDHLQDFFDFESYGHYMGTDVQVCSAGLIQIY